MKRFYFNMIEIILAIAILSIGISSVMVLFTSGLKANNSSVALSALPDAVESAISRVHSLAAFYASDDSWGNFVGGMSTSYTVENMGEFDTAGHPQETLIPRCYNGPQQYNFLYRQLSQDENGNYISTFSAVIRLKRRTHTLDLVHPATGAEIASSDSIYTNGRLNTHLNNCFAEVEMEISYPADLPYSARDIRNFRVELYNDKYNRICLP